MGVARLSSCSVLFCKSCLNFFSDGRYILVTDWRIEFTYVAIKHAYWECSASGMSPSASSQWQVCLHPPPAVPGLLEPPAVGKVTHHSVELSWRPTDHTPSAGRLHYCVQEKEKGREFTDVYK